MDNRGYQQLSTSGDTALLDSVSKASGRSQSPVRNRNSKAAKTGGKGTDGMSEQLLSRDTRSDSFGPGHNSTRTAQYASGASDDDKSALLHTPGGDDVEDDGNSKPSIMEMRSIHCYGGSEFALDLMNFFIADVQGLGALAFIYFTSSPDNGGLGLSTTIAGNLMLLQGLCTVAMSPFAGAYIDFTPYKRFVLSLALSVTSCTYLVLYGTQALWLVAIAFMIQGLVAAAYGPGVNALSLGLVGFQDLPRRASRNEIAKHVGGVVAAILPIVVVTDDSGYGVFFLIIAAMAILGIVSVLGVQESQINHSAARGSSDALAAAPLKSVFTRLDVIIVLTSFAFFHLANAPMLPQVGYKIDQLSNNPDNQRSMYIFGKEYNIDGKNGVSLATIVAQFIMVPVAKASGWLSKRSWAGTKRTMLVAFLTLPVRGVCFALSDSIWFLLSIQFLDGIGAGIFGVIVVLMISDLSHRTGRFNVMQGAGAAVSGVGAALGNGIAGSITQARNVNATFWVLSAVALVAIALLVVAPVRTELQMADEAEDRIIMRKQGSQGRSADGGAHEQLTFNPAYGATPATAEPM